MNKKLSLVMLILLLCITVAGCASLQKAIGETTPAQISQMQSTTAPITAAIPMPYALIGAPLIALLAAIGKNWWDDKHPTTKV